MKLRNRTKIIFLIIGDVAALYVALFVTLGIRYGSDWYRQLTDLHLLPFSLTFLVWLVIFYVSGLYDLRRLRNNIDFAKMLSVSILTSALFTIALFYLIPFFGIAPKTNLFIFIVLFAAVEALWRQVFNARASLWGGFSKVLLLGQGEQINKMVRTIEDNPQLGYEIELWLKKGESQSKNLRSLVKRKRINLVIIPQDIKKNPELLRIFYDLLASGIEIRDFPSFFESVFQKVPLSGVEESWFLENQIGGRRFYDSLKNIVDFLLALLLGVIVLPFGLLIAFLVKFTSPGPAIYQQVRIGKNNREFILYKFRTMRQDAEKNGAQWAQEKDARVTPFGRFLRHGHLDELPQLINVLRGDIAFVGPRPERPEFVKILEKEIPYYEIRHVVKPGVTGWAQINYPYGNSVADAYEKLQYDIYYLKNRSIIIDLVIILKTIKFFLTKPREIKL